MKFCKINETNKKIYDRYIPFRYFVGDHYTDYIPLGIYDDDRVVGAAILSVYDGTAEIEYLSYRNEYAEGVCEEALTEFVKSQPWDIFRIRYVADGVKEDLDAYDYVMLWLGYAPAPGDVHRFCAKLGDIIALQKKYITMFKEHEKNPNIVKGSQLSEAQISYYNNLFPYARYDRQPDNEELSSFLLRDNKPVAGIIAYEGRDGVLEFAWMDRGNETSHTVMELIFTVLLNALELYNSKTQVVICPYLEEVQALIGRFGFTEDKNGHETRIYTYYI